MTSDIRTSILARTPCKARARPRSKSPAYARAGSSPTARASSGLSLQTLSVGSWVGATRTPESRRGPPACAPRPPSWSEWSMHCSPEGPRPSRAHVSNRQLPLKDPAKRSKLQSGDGGHDVQAFAEPAGTGSGCRCLAWAGAGRDWTTGSRAGEAPPCLTRCRRWEVRTMGPACARPAALKGPGRRSCAGADSSQRADRVQSGRREPRCARPRFAGPVLERNRCCRDRGWRLRGAVRLGPRGRETVSQGEPVPEHSYTVQGKRYAVYVGERVSLAH